MIKKKNKSLYQPTWSKKMLKEFLARIDARRILFGAIPLLIRERETILEFNSNEPIAKSVYYTGFLAMEGFENVYYALSCWDEETKDIQNFIGYLELLNGMTDEEEDVPMIRGFIKSDLELFETVDVLLRDAKIFNSNIPIILDIIINFMQKPAQRIY